MNRMVFCNYYINNSSSSSVSLLNVNSKSATALLYVQSNCSYLTEIIILDFKLIVFFNILLNSFFFK